ncbi:MAG: ATP-binding protein [Chloroflexi bacterium]|nr:ATP-binding protein [Chloroflexota bacterium]
MKRFSTLRLRFALWVAVWLFLLLVAFGAYVYHRLSDDLSDSIDDSLRLSASQAIATISVKDDHLNFSDDIPASSTQASLVKHDLAIRLLDPEGHILRALGAYPKLPLTAESLRKAQKQDTDFDTLQNVDQTWPVRVYTTPIVTDNQLVGIIQVAQSMEDVSKTMLRLFQALLAGGITMVTIGAVGGYFLVTRALAPIDHITRTAHRISAEDLSARLNLPATNDEVGRLVTTFDEMLARLGDSFQRERQFTADASHELRTPLTAMQAILSVMRTERRTPEDYEQALSDLSEETDRLRTLVENLLQVARGYQPVALLREPIDLAALLCDVADSLSPLAEAKNLTLKCEVPTVLTFSGDSDGLIRLFVNLLDNAVQYTEQGSIVITAQATATRLEVKISDTGIGISREHLPHLFDRFYRVDKARASRGAGLGLAIALDIARAHGGTIEVSSTLQVGTIFTVCLPI